MDLFCPESRAQWRAWLEKNHALSRGVELVYYKKSSGNVPFVYREALEEALCFGWIDSTVRTIDEHRYKQQFTPRNNKSNWSRINRDLACLLEERGLMHDAGRVKIQIAKENGGWDRLVDCENGVIPPDLAEALGPGLHEIFSALSSQKKRACLWHIKEAKRPETRRRRIENILRLLSKETKEK